MKILERNEIDEQYKWKLEDIVATDDEWEKIYQKLLATKNDILKYSGKLNVPEEILKCFEGQEEQGLYLTKLYVYAKMRLDQDVSNSKYQALTDKIEMLSVDISTLSSFVVVELAANSKEFLLDLSRKPEFVNFDYTLTELARNKEHTLSKDEEKLLAMSSSFSDMFHDAFNMFDNADIQFKSFKNKAGETVNLSHGVYSLYMQSTIRADRKKAYESMFGAYKNAINTVSVLYAGNVKKDLFYAKARHFDSCLQKAMNNENVPSLVYEKLIACVNNNLKTLQKYYDYRRKEFGVKKLSMYDLHTSIVKEDGAKTSYEEATVIVKNALLPLGDDYQNLLNDAFKNKWIDVYENKGKRSGAYSWGTYGTHPYVLLNYQPTTHDIFTIAHELGHAMHTYYSNKTQPFVKADYEIFVAEVASTVNEVLLLQAMLKSSEEKIANEKNSEKREKEERNKKYLLSYMLDMFRTTVFRQTQFAEFEVVAHKMAEDGQSLTPDTLCEAYLTLNKKYYDEKIVESDELIKYEWARIPHFYRSFYVYKYATGLISAVCIAKKILTEGQGAVDNYKKFLSAGGSMPPVEILKLAGVDLTTDNPYTVAMNYFEEIFNQFKTL